MVNTLNYIMSLIIMDRFIIKSSILLNHLIFHKILLIIVFVLFIVFFIKKYIFRYINMFKYKYYKRKVKKIIKINFIDDYDILMNIFENEDNVISVISRLEDYDRDKQILIKILLNINKSININK